MNVTRRNDWKEIPELTVHRALPEALDSSELAVLHAYLY
jgi:hypothetical protein